MNIAALTALSRSVALAFVLILMTAGRVVADPSFRVVAGFDPVQPVIQPGLIPDPAGKYWGATRGGGASGCGTIFTVDPSTRAVATVLAFTGTGGAYPGCCPVALVADDSGHLWGATWSGGAYNYGTIFEVNMSTGALVDVVDFTSDGSGNHGSAPDALFIDGAGTIWGTTFSGGGFDLGTLFKINPGSGALASVIEFTGTNNPNYGSHPMGGLVDDGAGNIWGSTYDGATQNLGSVYSVNKLLGSSTTQFIFGGYGPTGEAPGFIAGGNAMGGLCIDGTGRIWGTSALVGSGTFGTVFSIDPTSGNHATSGFFSGAAGTGRGALPAAPLVVDASGNLWGTTFSGGVLGDGSVYKVTGANGLNSTIVDFLNTFAPVLQGGFPAGPVYLDSSGNAWGVTTEDGSNGSGIVYKVNLSTGFPYYVAQLPLRGAATGTPAGTLIPDASGKLWGATSDGGALGIGSLFKLDLSTGAVTGMAHLTGSLGAATGITPTGVVADSQYNFFGVARAGGANGTGTIFKWDRQSGLFSTYFNFDTPYSGATLVGANPAGSLVLSGSTFYGVAGAGGDNGVGTLYSFVPGAQPQEFFAFDALHPAGAAPNSLSIEGTGLFFGASDGFFPSSTGGVYSIAYGTGGSIFPGVTGSSHLILDVTQTGVHPIGPLVADGLGYYWGVTGSGGGAYGLGSVFKISRDGLLSGTSGVTTIGSFTGMGGGFRGSSPAAGLTGDGGGHLWGTAQSGGVHGLGVVYMVDVLSGSTTTVYDFTGVSGTVPGACPVAPLTFYSGTLYGATAMAGQVASGRPLGAEIFAIGHPGGSPTLVTNLPLYTLGGVILSATVPYNGIPGTKVYWQYGPAAGSYTYGQLGVQPLPGAVTPSAVTGTVPITGPSAFPPGIYHYQLVITTPQGTTYGPDQYFSLLTPTFTYGSIAITSTDATPSLTANPNGLQETLSLQWGTTVACSSGSTAIVDIGSGFNPVSYSPHITGLQPATFYFYRVAYTNVFGTGYSAVNYFTTPQAVSYTPLLSLGDAAAGIAGGATFTGISNAALTGSDHIGFLGTVAGPLVSATTQSGIWVYSGSAGTLVARTGASAPDATGTASYGIFTWFSDPVIANDDAVAFLGVIATTSTTVISSTTGHPATIVVPSSRFGLWATNRATGRLSRVSLIDASTGSSLTAITQFVMPDQGGVVFLGNAGSVAGVWAVDTSGALHRILYAGEGIPVHGVAKVISGITIFNADAVTGGQSRHFDSAGDLVYQVKFSDGSAGFLQSIFP